MFPLKSWLMKAFGGNNLSEEERLLNYRLSSARRTIENTFGIWSVRWRIFHRPIRASVSTNESIYHEGNHLLAQLLANYSECNVYPPKDLLTAKTI